MQDQQILKYLKGTVTDSEEKEIQEWIMASDQNTKRFNLVKAQFIASTFDKPGKSVQADKKVSDFLAAIDSPETSASRRFPPFLKYAAILSVIVGIGYLYATGFLTNEPEKLIIPEEAITLKLSDDKIKVIKFRLNKKILDANGKTLGTQSGNTIYYVKKEQSEKDTLIFNTLTVPYGKRFQVILSDGTHIHLNAGTSLKYPVQFLAGNDRQVFLDGEAFFDVAKDTEHPFVVNTDELNVTVLGTQFNVSSYPEDEFIRTVLVEGAVALSYDNGNSKATKLQPGYQAIWNKGDKSISIEETDVFVFNSWVDGRIVFRHMPFKNILKKLERHYNVDILSNNVILNEETFTASFDIESIEQVLETFNKNYSIGYTIKDNKIIIN